MSEKHIKIGEAKPSEPEPKIKATAITWIVRYIRSATIFGFGGVHVFMLFYWLGGHDFPQERGPDLVMFLGDAILSFFLGSLFSWIPITIWFGVTDGGR